MKLNNAGIDPRNFGKGYIDNCKGNNRFFTTFKMN